MLFSVLQETFSCANPVALPVNSLTISSQLVQSLIHDIVGQGRSEKFEVSHLASDCASINDGDVRVCPSRTQVDDSSLVNRLSKDQGIC